MIELLLLAALATIAIVWLTGTGKKGSAIPNRLGSFVRRNPLYFNPDRGTNGRHVTTVCRPNGKRDIYYRKGFKVHCDHDIDARTIHYIDSPHAKCPEGYIYVLPLTLDSFAGTIYLKRLVSRLNQVEQELDQYSKSLETLTELSDSKTSLHSAREAILQSFSQIKELRQAMSGDLREATQYLETQANTPDKKKEEKTTTKV